MVLNSIDVIFEKINSIYIEVSSQCNLACEHCFRTHHEYASKNKNMPLEKFKTIIDHLPPTKTYMLCPQGVGESILNKDFLKMLVYARDSKKFHRIEIHSNLLGASLETYYEMFACGLTNLYLSVDSLNEATLAQTRAGTDIEKLKHNIEAMVKNFGDVVELRITLSTLNINEVASICQWYTHIGGKKIQIAPLLSFGYDDSVQLSQKSCLKIIDDLKFKGVEFRFINPWEVNNTKKCNVFEETMSFDVLGRMTPCCVVTDAKHSYFGDMMQNAFTDILKKRNHFHEMLYQSRPEVCRTCYFYPKG